MVERRHPALPARRRERSTVDLDRLRVARREDPLRHGRRAGRLPRRPPRRDFAYVFLGVGAQKGKRLGHPRRGRRRASSTRSSSSTGPRGRADGPRASGSSSSAAATPPWTAPARRGGSSADGEVSLVYRRTRAEMPADPAEVRDCEVEGIGLRTSSPRPASSSRTAASSASPAPG